MSISNIGEKIKTLDEGKKERVFVVLLIILLGTASFGLGRLSVISSNKTPIRIENSSGLGENNSIPTLAGGGEVKGATTDLSSQPGTVFASKTGTAYYYPTCSGAARVSEKNRVWFKDPKDAEKFGLHIATGCKP